MFESLGAQGSGSGGDSGMPNMVRALAWTSMHPVTDVFPAWGAGGAYFSF